jgi:hypothetical protein
MTLNDYTEALSKLPEDWKAAAYDDIVLCMMGARLFVAKGCELSVYDPIKGHWASPLELGYVFSPPPALAPNETH